MTVTVLLSIPSVPPLSPEAMHIFIPVLYVLLFIVLLLGGFGVSMWRLFAWLKALIRGTVEDALNLHVAREEMWQSGITRTQEEIRGEVVEIRSALAEVQGKIEAVREELAEVKRIVNGHGWKRG